MSECLEAAGQIVRATFCPFAPQAEIAFAAADAESGGFADVAEQAWARLRSYQQSEEHVYLPDGLFMQFPVAALGEDIVGLAAGVNRLFRYIESKDVSASLVQPPMDSRWRLVVDGTEFAPILFGPMYEPSHPRHSPVPDQVFIFFQPQASFDRRLVAPSGSVARDALYRGIRLKFALQGRPYAKQAHGANRVILPLDATSTAEENLIKWYLN